MNPTSEQQLSESQVLACPFCLSQCIHAALGKTRCPVCDATFEIDDRGECVFGATDNIRLPAVGIICASCGFIQAGEYQHCLYCGTEVNTKGGK